MPIRYRPHPLVRVMRRKCDAGLEVCRQPGRRTRHFGREREPCGCGEARMLADGAWCGILFVLSVPTLLVAALLKGRLP